MKLDKTKADKPDSSYKAVMSTWYEIIAAIQQREHKKFVRLSLDSISACNNKMKSVDFIDRCSTDIVNKLLLTRIKDTSQIDVNNREVISSYFSEKFLSNLKAFGRTFVIRRVQVNLMDTEHYVVAFDFIETKKGLKFISCDVYGGPDCCR